MAIKGGIARLAFEAQKEFIDPSITNQIQQTIKFESAYAFEPQGCDKKSEQEKFENLGYSKEQMQSMMSEYNKNNCVSNVNLGVISSPALHNSNKGLFAIQLSW